MTKLIKTKKNSQFYRFHDNSEISNKIFTYKTPTIDDRKIEVLQVMYIDNTTYNVMIEFKYVNKE